MEWKKEKILELLLIDYKNRFKAMTAFEDRYHEKFKFIFFYLSGIAAIGTILNSLGINDRAQISDVAPKFIIFMILIALIFLLFFLIALMMNDLYYVYMNSVGMKKIEELINNIVGSKILIWNSEIFLYKFYDIRRWGSNKWIKPNYLTATFTLIITGFVMIIFGYLCREFADKYFVHYVIFSSIMTILQIHQWIKLHSTGIDYLNKEIYYSKSTIKELQKTVKND